MPTSPRLQWFKNHFPFLQVFIYIYASYKLPREIKRTFTPEEAVNYSSGRFLGFIRPDQMRSEIIGLSKIVESLKPKIIVEIGVARGGTLFLWARLAAKDARIVGINLPQDGWAYRRWKESFYQSFAAEGQTINLLSGNSQTQAMADELRRTLKGREIDFLFIDADHSYEGVKKDYLLYSPFVRKGGVIAFHDILYPPVKRLWDEVKGEKQEFVENKSLNGYGIGVLFV